MALNYTDVVVAFGVLVVYAGMFPWIYDAVNMLQAQVDPLTAVLVGAVPGLVLFAMILSMGVSARS